MKTLTNGEYIQITENSDTQDVIIETIGDNQAKLSIIRGDRIVTDESWILDIQENWVRKSILEVSLIGSMSSVCDVLDTGEIPVEFPDVKRFDMITYRNRFCEKYNMWGLVDLTWTKELSAFLKDKKCLEITAGSGWLSKALEYHGVDVIVTDQNPNEGYVSSRVPVLADIEIEELTAVEAIDKYAKDIDCLVCSWPPYSPDESGVLSLAVQQLKQIGINIPIVYIGERDGCTDSEDLWDNVEEVSSISIPNWSCIHDRCLILKMT